MSAVLSPWSPGNIHDILIAVGILAAIPIVARMRKLKWGFFMRRSYAIFSAFFLVGFVAALVLFTPGLLRENILLLRVFSTVGASYGHWLSWLAIFIVFVRYGYRDVFRGAFVTGVLVALHEGLWYFSYFAAHTARVDAVVLYYYWPFLFLLAAMLAMYFINVRALPRTKLAEVLVVLVVYYILWLAAGFPLTLDNITGITPFYGSLVVNFIEDASWLIPALVMAI